MTNVDTIKALYAAFKSGDFEAFKALCHKDIEWIQNEGFPGGGRHHGADAVIANVFQRFEKEWRSFGFVTESFHDAGSNVIVLGEYRGVHGATEKSMVAATAHVYDFADGLVIRFRQYTDTAMVVAAVS